MKKLMILLLLPVCIAAAKDIVPVDGASLDDLRLRLRAVNPANPYLLETRNAVTKDLSNISRRPTYDADVQHETVVRAINLLEFMTFYTHYSNVHFSLAKAPFVPAEMAAFPDFQQKAGLFGEGQKITDTLRFAGAQGEETDFAFSLYPLKDGLTFQLQTGEFKNESGVVLPGSIVSIQNTVPAVKTALGAAFRATYRIPKDAAPGLYRGTLQIACGEETYPVKLLLRVYPFTLPEPVSFQEKTPFLFFLPDTDGTTYCAGEEVISSKRSDKNVFLLHPDAEKLPEAVLKEGRIATRGTTEQFIFMPSENVLHIQNTVRLKDAARWHAVQGRILYAPSAKECSGNQLRRAAGLLPWRNHYDGVLLAGEYNKAALREAETDLRYVTLLRSLLKKAYAEKHYSGIFAAKKAVAWLMDIDPATYNLDLMRYELADHITYILTVMSKPTAEVQK